MLEEPQHHHQQEWYTQRQRKQTVLLAALLAGLLVVCLGTTLGLTFAPCYATFCSEKYFARETRLHIASYYALLASTGLLLLCYAYVPKIRDLASRPLNRSAEPVPVLPGLLRLRLTAGGLFLTFWILAITLATTAFWIWPEHSFWEARALPLDWDTAGIRLTVTGLVGHHADALVGLLLIPVGRNSLVGRVFGTHQGSLLAAHQLLAYGTILAAAVHGGAYFSFVGSYAASPESSKAAFHIDNPGLTVEEGESGSPWYLACLATGLLAFLVMLLLGVTSVAPIRRRAYNLFYYTHVVGGALAFFLVCVHASTNFYFLLPGLILWIADWALRVGGKGRGRGVDAESFVEGGRPDVSGKARGGGGGLRELATAVVEDAGDGWVRVTIQRQRNAITIPAPARTASDSSTSSADSQATLGEKKAQDVSGSSSPKGQWATASPIQSFYVNFPTISRLQNHAFTAAATTASSASPVFLLQRSTQHRKTPSRSEREWTWKLAALVAASSDGRVEMPVRLEGPYAPAWNGFRTARHVVCVVGGTGITGALSLASWWVLHRGARQHQGMTGGGVRFSLVWTVRHESTATSLREWTELGEECRSGAVPGLRLLLHVSSESGRLDPAKTLKDCLSETRADDAALAEKRHISGDREPEDASAEVYVSGPSGLLTDAETACLQVQRELRVAKRAKAPNPYAVEQLGFYVAKWEL